MRQPTTNAAIDKPTKAAEVGSGTAVTVPVYEPDDPKFAEIDAGDPTRINAFKLTSLTRLSEIAFPKKLTLTDPVGPVVLKRMVA